MKTDAVAAVRITKGVSLSMKIHQFLKLGLWLTLLFAPVQSAFAQSLPVRNGLRLWLDAADVNNGGAQPGSGAVVSTWSDKSGLSNNASAVGSASATFESAGLNGLPSVRLPIGSLFSGPNIYGVSNVSDTTIFFVQAYLTTQANHVLSLNGDGLAYSGTTARFTFHVPWTDNNAYIDAGGCCGTTRLSIAYPAAAGTAVIGTAGNAISGFSGVPGMRQFIRFNGGAGASDGTAIAPAVTGGFRLGSTAGTPYDGRFSEVIIYDRGLSLSEILQVECYLSTKWKISGPTGCSPVSGTITKTSTVYSGSPYFPFNVPGNDVIYSLNVNYSSGSLIDNNGVLLIDRLPNNVTFFNGDFDGPGPATDPVGFTNSGTGLSWSYASNVRFSNSATAPTTFAGCTYTPTAGYDPNVKFICINPSGTFAGGSFVIRFRAQIK